MATVAEQRPLLIVDTGKVADFLSRAQAILAELACLKIESDIIRNGGPADPELAASALSVGRQEMAPLFRTLTDLEDGLRDHVQRIRTEAEEAARPLREPITPWTPEQVRYLFAHMD